MKKVYSTPFFEQKVLPQQNVMNASGDIEEPIIKNEVEIDVSEL